MSPPSEPIHPEKRTLAARIGRILIGVLAAIGALAIVVFCFAAGIFAFIPLDKPDRVVSVVPSSNGKYKALKVTYAGGGAISPFCSDVILVAPASEPDDVAKNEKRYEVFSAQCDTFANHEPAPKVEWISGDVLQITFSINSTALSVRNVGLKKFDASGIVRIQFAAHE